jgi:hypothetical protein
MILLLITLKRRSTQRAGQSNGSYIGLWFLNAGNALADDFGGGTVVAGFGGGGSILAAPAPNVLEGSGPPITLARFVQPEDSRIVADSTLPQAPVAGGAAKGFASPLMPAQNGELTTTTITYTYDGLYRVKEAVYSTGEEFRYDYDAVGNVLKHTHIIGDQTFVTHYDYNDANQLLTAREEQNDIQLKTWYYLYDNNGSLTDVIPDGTTPVTDARHYTYNAAGFLTRAETHDGTSYQPQAEMQYNGPSAGSEPALSLSKGQALGERVSMTGWQGEISLTTTYTLDLTRRNAVLTADASSNLTFYLYGNNGPLAELTTSWAYYLADGTNTPRQMTDATGEVTLARSYTPWGEVRQQVGTGSFTWGYFGGLMDAATGLVYVGGGQYYDPATGRLLEFMHKRINAWSKLAICSTNLITQKGEHRNGTHHCQDRKAGSDQLYSRPDSFHQERRGYSRSVGHGSAGNQIRPGVLRSLWQVFGSLGRHRPGDD